MWAQSSYPHENNKRKKTAVILPYDSNFYWLEQLNEVKL